MRKKSIEQTIKHAFLSLPHDGLTEDVFEACHPTESTASLKCRPIRWLPAMTAVATSLALIVCGAVWLWPHSSSSHMTVSLDVNPSIAIDVDENETIVSITALNDDAAAILGNTDYAGQEVTPTVQTLINAMVQQGYLSDVANSVLISVDSTDTDKAVQMQAKLSGEVEQALAADGLSGAVMSQTLRTDKELVELAKQYGISTGKATLICRLMEHDPLKLFDDLADVSINDLNLLAQQLEANVQIKGAASDKAYISRDDALALAVRDAGVDNHGLMFVEVDMDYERGKMCYEVEFVCDGIEYEYDLDAVTGAILKAKQDIADDTDYDAGSYKNFSSVNCVDVVHVKATVLAHAGLTEQDITEYDIEWDYRKNLLVYEIEFESGRQEYEYFVNAETGEILDSQAETDDDDDDDKDEDDAPMDTSGWLSETTVKETVLAHAGVSAADVTAFECQAETDDGVAVYEIEFVCGGVEYEYTVDALSGNVLEAEND